MQDIEQKNLTQEEKESLRVSENKKKYSIHRWIALAIIFVCCIIISAITLVRNKPDIANENDIVTTGGKADIEPTPSPKPTSSPQDANKIGENAADITKALLVNPAGAEKKVAYLTFDDGPSSNTEAILNALNAYNAKATFFVTGINAQTYPELIKKEYELGHTIANHSFSHNYKALYECDDNFKNEVLNTENAIAGVIGVENVMKLFRFPGGSPGAARHPYRDLINQMGYKYVDWNALNSDADGKPFSADRSLSEIKRTCAGKGDVVILMHDANAKKISAETLPQILEYLKQQGYTFERIVP